MQTAPEKKIISNEAAKELIVKVAGEKELKRYERYAREKGIPLEKFVHEYLELDCVHVAIPRPEIEMLRIIAPGKSLREVVVDLIDKNCPKMSEEEFAENVAQKYLASFNEEKEEAKTRLDAVADWILEEMEQLMVDENEHIWGSKDEQPIAKEAKPLA